MYRHGDLSVVASICAANLVGQWSLPAQEIPAESLRLHCPGISRAAGLLEKLRRVSVKIVPWRTEIAVEQRDNFAHLRYTSSSRGTDVL